MTLTRLASAKVNLYLHVAAPDVRGYHPLQSLVMFADAGDEVSLIEADTSGYKLRPCLRIDGPFAAGLDTGEGNLVMKAVRAFEAASGVAVDRHDICLIKNLPVASGLGGGSADAGAVLHLLRQTYAPAMADDELAACAMETGADGVMCLWARTAVAEGYGERLSMLDLPQVPAVLVNPGVACPTKAVYDGFDNMGQTHPIDAAATLADIVNVEGLTQVLRHTRNDLQAPAIALQPVIADVMTTLEAQPETLLARMSGSGATCFALCATDADADALGGRIQRMWPWAWVVACRLG